MGKKSAADLTIREVIKPPPCRDPAAIKPEALGLADIVDASTPPVGPPVGRTDATEVPPAPVPPKFEPTVRTPGLVLSLSPSPVL